MMTLTAYRPAAFVLLAAVGMFGVRQVAAATIADLKSTYAGTTHSHVNVDNELVDAAFTVAQVTQNRFTGTFDDGGFLFAVKGTVSRTGKVAFNGTYSVPKVGTRLTIRGTGNLSAAGTYFIGSATENGRRNGVTFKDAISFVLTDGALVNGASQSDRQPKKK